MKFTIKTQGLTQVETSFTRLGEAAVDARRALNQVALLIFEIESRLFDSEGRRGGGSWKQDSVEWLTRKMRNGLDPRINHATLALRDAVTEPGAPHQVFRLTRQSLEIAVDLPYAAVSQRNRPFIKFTKGDRMEMRDIVRSHLMNAWRGA